MMRRAFTLIEVNLAMLIMAGGVLAVVGLYALGFRENRQGREDVIAAAYADAVVSPLVMAISATNLKWSVFRNMASYPGDDGWGSYFNNKGVVDSDPHAKASSVYSSVIGEMRKAAIGTLDLPVSTIPSPPTSPRMSAGLVVMHQKDSAVVTISFRAVESEKFGELLAMPLFYTEVRFQGVVDQ